MDDHNDWNRRERGETPSERADRNFDELLQELRVAQTGTQILLAFLLGLAFTQRFGQVTGPERALYYVTMMLTALAASLFIAPASLHRLVFRRHAKARLVSVTNGLAIAGLASLCLSLIGVVWFITDILYGGGAGGVAAVVSTVWFAILWYVLPLTLVRRQPPPDPF